MGAQPPDIAAFLASAAFAVVGASNDRAKYGNKVLRCYQQHGKPVVGVNPKLAEVEGVPCHASLRLIPGRCGYWFYFFRMKPEAFRCNRAEFVKALAAEGVDTSAGYVAVPLHRNPVFLKHGFFAGHWPVREAGLTTMDYSKHQTPEAEAILQTGIRIVIHEGMTEDYIAGVAEAIGKVARHYAV